MNPTAPLISLQRVSLRFAQGGVQALQDVSLSVREGEFVSLLGPSGCGKSTVLRLAAGLAVPTVGQVNAPALTGTSADTAFVFQDATLMPWATVFDNVRLPLRLAGVDRREARERVLPLLDRLGLAGFAHAYPGELSGGMRMRVSIARALVTRPRVLLMDEPFAALDEITRQRLNDELLALWATQRPAVLFVTHSVSEAVYLSQRVLVMGARPGRVVAEHEVQADATRDAGWRLSPPFAQQVREVSGALADAMAEPAG